MFATSLTPTVIAEPRRVDMFDVLGLLFVKRICTRAQSINESRERFELVPFS